MTHPDGYAQHLDRLWGCGDIDRLFHGGDRALLPWPRRTAARGPAAARHRAEDIAELARFVVSPIVLTLIDPRTLTATQPWLIRHHAAYYASGEWERTGITSADRHSPLNRVPVIECAKDRYVIRSGHHRAFVALIEGRAMIERSWTPTQAIVERATASG